MMQSDDEWHLSYVVTNNKHIKHHFLSSYDDSLCWRPTGGLVFVWLEAISIAPAEVGPSPAAQKPRAARPAAAAPQARPAKLAHPLASLGGHQMPTFGKIGGQKGVGAVEAANQASIKRKREDTGEPF